MLGNINVGWAVPPFGLDALEEEQIRIIARANDVPKVRNKTTRVIISSANTLEGRKEVLARFMQAYRETIEWMYSDPAAIKSYAEIAGISEAIAHRLRDAFSPKNMLAPDQVSGLNAAINDAVSLRYIRSLSSKQISELIQIPAPLTAQSVGGWRRLFSTQP
jgi:NitT/TauT family transport system substrate-binding protein